VPNPNAVLDSEGAKAVPGVCIACHGGTYDATKHNMSAAARFLPFDTPSFLYDTVNAQFSAPSQADTFRILNAIVRSSSTEGTAQKTSQGVTFQGAITSQTIRDLIDGWYSWCVGVDTKGCSIDDQNHRFIPSGTCGPNSVTCGWNQNPDTYQQFPRVVCRTCHVAHSDIFNWEDYTFVTRSTSLSQICTALSSYSMPFAQVPYNEFWTDTVGSSAFTSLLPTSACQLKPPPQ